MSGPRGGNCHSPSQRLTYVKARRAIRFHSWDAERHATGLSFPLLGSARCILSSCNASAAGSVSRISSACRAPICRSADMACPLACSPRNELGIHFGGCGGDTGRGCGSGAQGTKSPDPQQWSEDIGRTWLPPRSQRGGNLPLPPASSAGLRSIFRTEGNSPAPASERRRSSSIEY